MANFSSADDILNTSHWGEEVDLTSIKSIFCVDLCVTQMSYGLYCSVVSFSQWISVDPFHVSHSCL